ncbi:MAG: Gfo/Idh/MocA family oxidoreductase [bacterium]
MSTDGPVTVALAGTGRWGTNYLRTLAGMPDLQLVAVAEPESARARAVLVDKALPVFTGLDELLNDIRPAAVIIATPDSAHAKLALTGIAAGCDVLVEKPMARCSSDAGSCAAAARQNRSILMVGHTTLYHPAFAQLRDALPSAGPVRFAHAERSSVGTRGTTPVWDLAAHDVAAALTLFGPVASIRASGESSCVEYELNHATGTVFTGTARWTTAPALRRLTVTGSTFRLVCDETAGTTQPLDQPLARLCRAFVTACRSRQQPVAGAFLGLEVVRCLEAMTTAVSTGDEVPVRSTVTQLVSS